MNDTLKEAIRKILQDEAEAIRNIPITDSIKTALDLIYEAVHVKNGKLVTSGMGKAGLTAISIAMTMSATGTPAIFLHPSDAQHGDLGVLQKNDVLLLISNSGKTREVLELYNLSKNLYPDIPTIVITANKLGDLPKMVDATIYTGNPGEVCALSMSPTTSATVMAVIGDILIVEMTKRINFTAADYAKRHHGGYLGEKSRSVSRTGYNPLRKY